MDSQHVVNNAGLKAINQCSPEIYTCEFEAKISAGWCSWSHWRPPCSIIQPFPMLLSLRNRAADPCVFTEVCQAYSQHPYQIRHEPIKKMPMLGLRQPLVPCRGAEDTNSGSPFFFSYLLNTLPALAGQSISPIYYTNTHAESTNRASATWLT